MSKTYTLRLLDGGYFLTQEIPQATRFTFLIGLNPFFGETDKDPGFDMHTYLEGNLRLRLEPPNQAFRKRILVDRSLYLTGSSLEKTFWSVLYGLVANFVTSGDAFQIELTCEGEKSERLGENLAERFTRLDRDFGHDHRDERGL